MPKVYVERERRAFICVHASHDMPYRVFMLPGEPDPKCPQHGKMKRQVNLVPKGKR